MTGQSDSDEASTRKPSLREAILCAAEELFSTNGFNAVSVRDIAQAAGANPGSVTYHFKTKDGLLLEIYGRHCGPMNRRRSESRIVRRRHHIAPLEHRAEPLDRGEEHPRERRRAAANDACRWMRPGDHRSAAGRRRSWRRNDHARDFDRLAVKTGRPIEDAIGPGALGRAQHRLGADEIAGTGLCREARRRECHCR